MSKAPKDKEQEKGDEVLRRLLKPCPITRPVIRKRKAVAEATAPLLQMRMTKRIRAIALRHFATSTVTSTVVVTLGFMEMKS
ncbi:hypothetical protein ABUE31_02610 [Mesorhizobium sp. ZMM04-5]|uniref:Uncharacterized protein n=1 Tax=Mesorhizobium marinum TaxID=3228790 RepID=A0ABV3QV77_9HYPH